jgi:membrane protein
MKPKTIYHLIKRSAQAWSEDHVSTLSASLAYSTVFSISPLLVITLGVVGFIFGTQGSSGAVFDSIQSLLGPDGAKAIEGMVQATAKKPESGRIASLIGLVVLILGASSVFQQIQQSLNMIWKVKAKPHRGIWDFIRKRLLSFAMILVIAFLLLVSLVLSAGLTAIGSILGDIFPGGIALWQTINIFVSFSVITGLFAAIFKILPDVKLSWRDVWIGGGVTALFFTIGKGLIGLYLGRSGVASSYGAVGSLVVVLLWVYYSSAILFFGAEFTREYATRHGRMVVPIETAILEESKN